MKDFGENLRMLMRRRGLTTTKVAQDLEISVKSIHEWVGPGGRTPRDFEAIKKLAAYFDVSTHFILFGEEDPKGGLANFLSDLEVHSGTYKISITRIRDQGL